MTDEEFKIIVKSGCDSSAQVEEHIRKANKRVADLRREMENL